MCTDLTVKYLFRPFKKQSHVTQKSDIKRLTGKANNNPSPQSNHALADRTLHSLQTCCQTYCQQHVNKFSLNRRTMLLLHSWPSSLQKYCAQQKVSLAAPQPSWKKRTILFGLDLIHITFTFSPLTDTILQRHLQARLIRVRGPVFEHRNNIQFNPLPKHSTKHNSLWK